MNDDIKLTIDNLQRQINRGWLLYGRYMDSDTRNHPAAMELKATIGKLTMQKAQLELLYSSDDVVNFIKEHGGSNG